MGGWWERKGEEWKGGKSKPFSISDELWLILFRRNGPGIKLEEAFLKDVVSGIGRNVSFAESESLLRCVRICRRMWAV